MGDPVVMSVNVVSVNCKMPRMNAQNALNREAQPAESLHDIRNKLLIFHYTRIESTHNVSGRRTQ